MTTNIKETNNYVLITGTSFDKDREVYQIINRDYNIVEVESSILPEALSYVDNLQAAMDEENKKNAPVDVGKVIDFNS